MKEAAKEAKRAAKEAKKGMKEVQKVATKRKGGQKHESPEEAGAPESDAKLHG